MNPLGTTVRETLAGLSRFMFQRLFGPPAQIALLAYICNRLTAAGTRFARLHALWLEGRLPKPRPHTARATTPQPAAEPKPRLRLPRRMNWLRLTFGLPFTGPSVVGFAAQFQHRITQPDAAAFLAACPGLARQLRPLCRLMGIDPMPPHLAVPPRPIKPRPPKPPRIRRPKPGLPRVPLGWPHRDALYDCAGFPKHPPPKRENAA